MKDLFQADNPLIRILECFFDLMELNFLFILTSLPLFTIGSSLCALYNTSIKMIRKEGISIHKNYMHCFRKQFKSATPLWICLFLLCAFFLTDLYIVCFILDRKYVLLQVPFLILLFVLFSIIIYAFPLLSFYEATLKDTLKNAILLSLSNLPTTILILFIPAFLLFLSSLSGKNPVMIGSLLFFFGFAALACFYSLFLSKILLSCEKDVS